MSIFKVGDVIWAPSHIGSSSYSSHDATMSLAKVTSVQAVDHVIISWLTGRMAGAQGWNLTHSYGLDMCRHADIRGAVKHLSSMLLRFENAPPGVLAQTLRQPEILEP